MFWVQLGSVVPVDALLVALEGSGLELTAWGLAWARVLPTMLIVPAFGATLLPGAARAVLGLAFAVVLIPSVALETAALGGVASGGQLGLRFVLEGLRGLPIALSTAALLWAAMMAGGLIDDLRGATQQSSSVFADAPTGLGTLLGLFVAMAFLNLGGASRVVEALTQAPNLDHPLLLRTVHDLVRAVEVALALAAPVLGAVVVWEVTGALITRAASPAHTLPMLAPLRSLVILGVLAFSLDGMLALLTRLLAA